MTPYEAKVLWNQMRFKSARIDDPKVSDMERRSLIHDVANLERVLKAHGRFNPEGKLERVEKHAESPPPAVTSRRPKRAGKKRVIVPSKNLPWGGGVEPMRKIVGWVVDDAKKHRKLPMFDELLRYFTGHHQMTDADAEDTARFIFDRLNIAVPAEYTR